MISKFFLEKCFLNLDFSLLTLYIARKHKSPYLHVPVSIKVNRKNRAFDKKKILID